MKSIGWILILIVFATNSFAQTPAIVEKKTYKASLDKEFSEGSTINITSLSDQQITNLALLGKMWGFLKYHHPAIAKGDYNWDFELFRIIPKILAVKNDVERNDLLSNWIDNLGNFETTAPKVMPPASIKYKPNFDWVLTSGLSKKLIEQINKIKIATRAPESYYVKLYDADTPVPVFLNEEKYFKFKYPDDGYRLLALFRFWSIIEYFAPYRNLTDKPWGNILVAYIPKFIADKDELAYKLTATEMVAEINDSHADLSPYDNTFKPFYGANQPNVEITFIDSKPVVIYSNDEVQGINSLKKGDIIQTVNDIPVAKMIKQKLPYMVASNYPTQLRKMALLFLRTNDTLMKVIFTRGTQANQSTTLKTYPFNRTNYKKPLPADTGFKMISNIAYFHPGRLGNRLKAVMPTALTAKGIILDLRTYPKPTSFAWDLGKYIFSKPMDIARYTQGSVETPGLFTYMSDEYMAQARIGESNKDAYKGKIIIIVNDQTQSLGELSVMALSMRPNTIIIGSQTAGADGSVGMAVPLPGGIGSSYTQIGVYYPDNRETQRIGIVPNVLVNQTAKGIAEGRDELLEKAISLIENK